MSLPTWITQNIAEAQRLNDDTHTTWSVYQLAPEGHLVPTCGAHDRAHADHWLNQTRDAALVAPTGEPN